MAFTTLVLFQSFNVFNARSDERSAFRGLITNRWLWLAIIVSALAARIKQVHLTSLESITRKAISKTITHIIDGYYLVAERLKVY